MAKGMKTGGRKVGTPNRATADIKAVTGAYTSEAVQTLVDLMRNETTPPAVRLAAFLKVFVLSTRKLSIYV